MGYELTRFIGNIDEELQCCICTMVLERPVQTRCDHLYCNSCIRSWLVVESVCPIDAQPLTMDGLHPPSRLLRNLLNKLPVRCLYYDIGCLEIMRLDHSDTHCAACTFNPDAVVACDKGCKLVMPRWEYNEYDCLTHYEKRIICQQDEILNLKNEIGQFKATVTKLDNENIQLKSHINKLKGESVHSNNIGPSSCNPG